MTVTTRDEIELNGKKYRIKGGVRGLWENPFPDQITIGDPDYSNRRDLSSWIIDGSGGIGVEEMDEKKDWNKCWWTNCITEYPNHTLPPRLPTALTNPTSPTLSNVNCEQDAVGWTNGARSAAQAHGGTYSWLCPSVTVVYQDSANWTNDLRGATVRIDAWIYLVSAGTPSGTFSINDGVDTTTADFAGIVRDQWNQFTINHKINAAATRLRVQFSASTTGAMYFDDVQEVADNLYTLGTISCAENFNGNLYWAFGRTLVKLSSDRTKLTYLWEAPATITKLISSLNSRLYIYMGDSQNYQYMSTAEAFTASNSANANWAFQYDAKLFKVNTSGTVAYSTDPDGAAPTWTSGGAITDIASQIQGFVVGRDASGTINPYGATKSILKAYDSTTPQWVDTEINLNNHPLGGKGHCYWNGKIWLSYGLAVRSYLAETGEPKEVGLTERDGLPSEFNGEITKLAAGGSLGIFAAIDASITSGNSKSGLYLYDGSGWHCWWASPGLRIHHAPSAWDEYVDANVTVAGVALTDTPTGYGRVTLTVAAGASAGNRLATNDISSTDISTYDTVAVWLKSSVALSSGDLQLLLDDTASCVSPLETIDIPAVSANTWTRVYLTLANPASDTAIISAGIKMVVDKGAFTLDIDLIEAFDYDAAMTEIIVSSASSGYAVYFDAGGTVRYIDIPRGIDNPDKITQSYERLGTLITPWFDAGNGVASKLLKVLEATYQTSVSNYISIKYRTDHVSKNFDSNWTVLAILSNVDSGSQLSTSTLASGAGLSYKAIQYRIDFITTASTSKPDLERLIMYYKKRTGSTKLRVWTVEVVCDDHHTTKAKEKVANLKSAIESTTDVLFSYHPNDDATESYYVTVDCPEFREQSGREGYTDATYILRLTKA